MTTSIITSSLDTLVVSNELHAEKILLMALKDIPIHEKIDVLQALQIAPDLFRTDCKPLQFLRVENFNAYNAAKRLTNYWKLRKFVFDDRAYKPLNLLGTGAMDFEDIEAFKHGYWLVLPEQDKDGCIGILFDKRNFFENLSMKVRFRCCFYLYHVVSENEKSYKNNGGVRTMCLLDRMEFTPDSTNIADMITAAFPIKFNNRHDIFSIAEPSSNRLVAKYATNVAHLFGDVTTSAKNNDSVILHTVSTLDEIKRICINELGFPNCSIPISLGGTWGINNEYINWINERITIETLRLLQRNNSNDHRAGPIIVNNNINNNNNTSLVNYSTQLRRVLLNDNNSGCGGSNVGGNFNNNSLFFTSSPLIITGVNDNNNLRTRTRSVFGNDQGSCNNNNNQSSSSSNDNCSSLLLQSLLSLNNNSMKQPAISTPPPPLPGNTINLSVPFNTPLGISTLPPSTACTGQTFIPIIQHNNLNNAIDLSSSVVVRGIQNRCTKKTNFNNIQSRLQSTSPVAAAAAATVSVTTKCHQNNDPKIDRDAFDEALAMIPDTEKSAYLEAMQKVPSLVATESDPTRFILVEDYNSWAAARRFVNYWELRKRIFGERAFLPMTQTGTGTLTKDDVLNLSCGSTALVHKDDENCHVIVNDRSRRLEGDSNGDARVRTLFYLASVASEEKTSQTKGVVAVVLVVSPRVLDINPDVAKRRHEVLRTLPMKLKTIHLVFCPPKTGKRKLIDRCISLATQFAQSLVGKRTVVHIEESAAAVLRNLKQYGLSASGLPTPLGGTYKYEEFLSWQRDRTQYEAAIYKKTAFTTTTTVKKTGTSSSSSSSTSMKNSTKKNTTTTTTTTTLSEVDKEQKRNDRKRQMNIIFSRQKRERRKAEVEELNNKHQKLMIENEYLKHSNKQLEQLLKLANDRISNINKARRK